MGSLERGHRGRGGETEVVVKTIYKGNTIYDIQGNIS